MLEIRVAAIVFMVGAKRRHRRRLHRPTLVLVANVTVWELDSGVHRHAVCGHVRPS
jgi:hypothetical protein